MVKSRKICAWQLGLGSVGALTLSMSLFMSNSVFAQSAITPDSNLGNESSQVIQNYLDATEAIAKGAIRDRNLFHSLREFNVSEGRSAVFLSPNSNIQNILVRVTGNNRSEILGTLSIVGSNANLFLVNPNGIFFGANARLNIGGSFVASTASGIKFADDTVFSATNPQTAPLLTISTPVGLQFDQLGGEINHYGALEVPLGKTLALVGGNINLIGNGQLQENRRTLKAFSGQIAIGGISQPGTIQINIDSQNQPLSFPNNVTPADISFKNLAVIVADGLGSGFIQLQGRQIQLTDGSIVQADTQGSENGRGIVVQAQQLTLQDGSQIVAGTSPGTTGIGGSLTVKVTDLIQVSGTIPQGKPFAGFPSGLATRTFGDGAAGLLTVETKKLIIDGGANITTTAWQGRGDGGMLKVTATDSILLSGASFQDFPSGLFSQTLDLGNAGSIIIDTKQFIAQNGGVITAGTGRNSRGNGSSLTVRASELIDLSGVSPIDKDPSGLFARSRGSGEAGSLFVNTEKLIVRDGARLTVEALGRGNAGILAVNATEMRLERQSKVVAETVSGNGGDLTLEIQNLLLLRDRAQISTTAGTSGGGGNGGNITINTPNGFIVAVPQENSDITANAFTGSGGRVEINAYDIFGIEQRSREDLVTLLNTKDPTQLNPQLLQTNDITAISQTNPTLSGVVDINTPDVDPNSGLVNLPTQPVELKVDETCKVIVANDKSSFTVIGRGGIPSNPTQTLNSEIAIADWIAVDNIRQPTSQPTASLNSPSPHAKIVEATGWAVNPQGEVVLTAHTATGNIHSSWYKSTDCTRSQPAAMLISH
ncbi:filamentous hemagglutinin N-terminal domain-containing protein [Tolypothrix sp. FACHB-123]|uniref:two-partner secretion domain-containing protein n=1 Tax=Tolypothrix sp. FACHB-123 TaxID=2692868 RepID=UPI00168657A9|nr:filamentous hemagglutinin N-terminal domain-containing protein [Tolypothrix sp. FACHB-123]MBD2357558.1 filamentous hemagglutinin N-terminal domain-containing protein [Tolypothrix sp. FACHB-123]